MSRQAIIIKSAKDCDIDLLDNELKKGIDINDDNNNLLLYSVIFGNSFYKKEYIDFLIKNKIDINQKSLTGRTALHFASMFSDFETVKQLVDNGIDINAINYEKYNALMEACCSITHFASMKLHLDGELEALNISYSDYYFLWNHYNELYRIWENRKIFKENQIKIIEYLLEHGTDKEQLSNDNRTALDLAIDNQFIKNTKMVEILSKNGVPFKTYYPSVNYADALFGGGPLAFIDEATTHNLKVRKLKAANKWKNYSSR